MSKPRYIDVNKIRLTGLPFEDVNHNVYFSLSDIIRAIEQTPIADVVEVVRCKDCKHRGDGVCPMCFEEYSASDDGEGYMVDDWITIDNTQDDAFCSYGERKVQK